MRGGLDLNWSSIYDIRNINGTNSKAGCKGGRWEC